MIGELYAQIAQINKENNLEINLDTIAEIYGNNIVEKMAEMPYDVITSIEHLISLDFGEDVTDVCNRNGILLCYNSEYFCDKVWELVRSMGDNYVEKMGEDMSC